MKDLILPLLLSLCCLFTCIDVSASSVKAISKKENKTIKVTSQDSNPITIDKQKEVDLSNKKQQLQSSGSINNSYNSDFENTAQSYSNLESVNESTAVNNTIVPKNNTSYKKAFSKGLFYGFLCMLIVLNFVCFILFDDKAYLFYGITISTIGALFFFHEDLMTLFDIYEIQNPEITKTTFLFIATLSITLFSSNFLVVEHKFSKLKYIVSFIFATAGLAFISGVFTNSQLFLSISNTLLLSIITSYFLVSVILFKSKNYAKFYAIASAIPLLFTIDYLVLQPAGIHFLQTTISHLKGATLIEMIVLSYAILYRMNEIKEENLLKQTELRIFLKQQEMTAREKTELHIEDQYLENVIMQYDLGGLEIKLLQYISEGKTNEKIARKLKMTEHDLEEKTNELYKKLEIREHIKEDYRLVDSQPDYIYN